MKKRGEKTKLIKLVPLLSIDNFSGQIYKIYGFINYLEHIYIQ